MSATANGFETGAEMGVTTGVETGVTTGAEIRSVFGFDKTLPDPASPNLPTLASLAAMVVAPNVCRWWWLAN